MRIVVACFITEFVLCHIAAGQDIPDQEKLKKAVTAKTQEFNQYVLRGQYAKMADLLHPKILALTGGKDKTVEGTKKIMEMMKAKGFDVDSITIDGPVELAGSGNAWFGLVPTTMVMTAPGGKLTMKAYTLGISEDKGLSWTFVRGDVGKAAIEKMFPNIPSGLKIPDLEKPTFTPNK